MRKADQVGAGCWKRSNCIAERGKVRLAYTWGKGGGQTSCMTLDHMDGAFAGRAVQVHLALTHLLRINSHLALSHRMDALKDPTYIYTSQA